MTNKLTLTEQEELFAKDCKLINLKYEYNGYTGDERWAIITELSVKELWEKYPLVIENSKSPLCNEVRVPSAFEGMVTRWICSSRRSKEFFDRFPMRRNAAPVVE